MGRREQSPRVLANLFTQVYGRQQGDDQLNAALRQMSFESQ
jgi:hypothetical protein